MMRWLLTLAVILVVAVSFVVFVPFAGAGTATASDDPDIVWAPAPSSDPGTFWTADRIDGWRW